MALCRGLRFAQKIFEKIAISLLLSTHMRGIIRVQSREVPRRVRWQGQKGVIMNEPMTDFQFKAILKMVFEVLKSSESIEEAIAKVEALVEDEGK